jgi:3-hydroxymyristoyl/3-hydroxydecanoyl-(acyl carrier protein) dehydratase
MELELKFSADEHFFKGHYPGYPVTPGVMLIDKAHSAAETLLNRKIVLKAIKKVKFSNPILPEEVVVLKLEQKGEGEMAYSFSKEGVQCASGTFVFECSKSQQILTKS